MLPLLTLEVNNKANKPFLCHPWMRQNSQLWGYVVLASQKGFGAVDWSLHVPKRWPERKINKTKTKANDVAHFFLES